MNNIEELIQEGAIIEEEHAETYAWMLRTIEEGNIPSAQEFYEHIAADHISEHEDYYPALRAMEKSLEESE